MSARAIGIDLGGSKIAAHVFDADWREIAADRVPTPARYDDLVAAIARLGDWAGQVAGDIVPIGIGAAGRHDPGTGRFRAANHAADGMPFRADLDQALGRPVALLNDAAAFALAEGALEAGAAHRTTLGLVIGTGFGGGLVAGGRLLSGDHGGEFGHMAAPAAVVAEHGLSLRPCGCGSIGCVETFLSGPGLTALIHERTGRTLRPEEAVRGGTGLEEVWSIWSAIAASVLRDLVLATGPDAVVLGGGLGLADGVRSRIDTAFTPAMIEGFPVPPLLAPTRGDTAGALGAAYAAWRGDGYD